jgi:hypothetical protein
MKTLLRLLLLFLVCPAARGDTQTLAIVPGINYIGAHVVDAPIATPALSGITGDALGGTITYGAGAWTNLTTGLAYTVEHPTQGWWCMVTGINNSTRTLTVSPGWTPGVGVTPVLRRVMTVADLYDPNLGPMIKGPALLADMIWVPSGSGWKKYWRNNAGKWRRVGTAGDRGNDPVYFIQGMVFQRRGTTNMTLTFTGDSMTVSKLFGTDSALTQYSVTPRRMLVSSVFGGTSGVPGVKTLDTCGLSSTIQQGVDISSADNILMPLSPGGAIQKYFYSSDALAPGWLDSALSPAGSVSLNSAFIYKLRSIPRNDTLVP